MNEHDFTGVRRDSEPHRAPLLKLLAVFVLAFSFGSWAIIPGLAGLALAVTVRIIAARDLRRIDEGLMDPAGQQELEKARTWAKWGLFLNLAGLFPWCCTSPVHLLPLLAQALRP